jgi:hypothetical protein
MRFFEFIRIFEAYDDSYTSQAYAVRVKQGRENEDKSIIAMRKPPCNLKVRKGTEEEEHLGIDCWITMGGSDHSVQIKHRLTGGNNFHYEVYVDYGTPKQKPGRDKRVQAEFFAFIVQGTLYLVKTLQLRKAVSEIINKMDSLHAEKPFQNTNHIPISYKGVDCEVQSLTDASSGRAKLLVYMPVSIFDLFTNVYRCKIAVYS